MTSSGLSKCVDEFPFMAISEEKGLNEGIDGILGLGPNHQNGPSLLLAMRYQDKINKTIVSFSLGYNNGDHLR